MVLQGERAQSEGIRSSERPSAEVPMKTSQTETSYLLLGSKAAKFLNYKTRGLKTKSPPPEYKSDL